jgi:hypothetical protein
VDIFFFRSLRNASAMALPFYRCRLSDFCLQRRARRARDRTSRAASMSWTSHLFGVLLTSTTRLGGAARGSTMHGTDARLNSQERNLISTGRLRWLARALRSTWSIAIATAIFALALVVLQVGLIAVGSGLDVFTRSFGAAF